MNANGSMIPRGFRSTILVLAMLVLSGVCLLATPALVQSASAGSTNGQTSVSATFASTPAPGNLLVAIAGAKSGDSVSGVVSASGGWTAAINEPGTAVPSRPGQAIFYRIAGASEATQVTATGGPTTLGLQIFEYSGAGTLDVVSSGSGAGNQPASTGTVSTSAPDELLVAGVTINTSDNITGVSNSFNSRFNFVSGFSGGRQTFGSADRFDSAGNNSTTFSHGNNSWRAQIVAFKNACTAGLLMVDTEVVGYPPNYAPPYNFSAQAANNVAFSFAKSQPAAVDYAIFQTHDPFGATVVKDAITNAGHGYVVFTPADLANVTFSDYRVVVLNWDDTVLSGFQPAYGNAIPALESYVRAGGVVWIQGAMQSTTAETYPLPFGGTATMDKQLHNFIVDTSSPLAAGLANPVNGNFASHMHLTGLPAAADVVIVTGTTNAGLPTLYTLVPCP